MERVEPRGVKGVTLRVAVLLSSVLLFAYGCRGGGAEGGEGSGNAVSVSVKIVVPARDTTIVCGTQLKVRWVTEADSCQVFLGTAGVVVANGMSASIGTASSTLGVQHVRVVAWKDGYSNESSRRVTILAAASPQEYGYRVIREFPHDENAYTQGLLFHDGFLYESTGQRGASTVRKVDLSTGKVLQERQLINSEFGEGIALHKGLLYQLTWTSHRCHLYELETFAPMGDLYYSTQGWGLESDGTYLYMTDGTENIYVLNPETFEVVRTIQAYTSEGPQRMLNELEFINGLLYANVYLTDEIVAVEPKTGAVVRRIYLGGLLPHRYRTPHVEVLNGIAYDAESRATYLTGKYWPKLYHVEFVAK